MSVSEHSGSSNHRVFARDIELNIVPDLMAARVIAPSEPSNLGIRPAIDSAANKGGALHGLDFGGAGIANIGWVRFRKDEGPFLVWDDGVGRNRTDGFLGSGAALVLDWRSYVIGLRPVDDFLEDKERVTRRVSYVFEGRDDSIRRWGADLYLRSADPWTLFGTLFGKLIAHSAPLQIGASNLTYPDENQGGRQTVKPSRVFCALVLMFIGFFGLKRFIDEITDSGVNALDLLSFIGGGIAVAFGYYLLATGLP